MKPILIAVSNAAIWAAFLYATCGLSIARDDGSYAQRDPTMHAWFDHLASGKGLCCSFADGRTVDDPDVDSDGNHYRVRVDGTWYDVPDNALVNEPNKYGQAVVWPFTDIEGKTQIRCFLPGAMG